MNDNFDEYNMNALRREVNVYSTGLESGFQAPPAWVSPRSLHYCVDARAYSRRDRTCREV